MVNTVDSLIDSCLGVVGEFKFQIQVEFKFEVKLSLKFKMSLNSNLKSASLI